MTSEGKWTGLLLIIIGYVMLVFALIMFEIGITQLYTLITYTEMTGLTSMLPPAGILAYIFFITLGMMAFIEGARENMKIAVSGTILDSIIVSIIGIITIAIAFIMYPVFFERLQELITLLES